MKGVRGVVVMVMVVVGTFLLGSVRTVRPNMQHQSSLFPLCYISECFSCLLLVFLTILLLLLLLLLLLFVLLVSLTLLLFPPPSY